MKIFGFFYSEKVIFYKNKKNSIITQQEDQYTLLGMTTGGFGAGRSHPDSARLFFSIFKLTSFKKLNKVRRRWKNSQTHPVYILFLFLFFLYLLFYFYYIQINIFYKNKNIMNFYILFIKNHYNNNYYLY